MKQKISEIILGFFKDERGQFSMMRLCTFILVVGGLVLCFIYPDKTIGEIVIGMGLTGKWGQKYLEKKENQE